VSRPETVGTIPGPVSGLKLKRLDKKTTAIVVYGLAKPDGTLYNPKKAPKEHSSGRVYTSLFVRHWDEYSESLFGLIH